MPSPRPAARFHIARGALMVARDLLVDAIEKAHPKADCLPLPAAFVIPDAYEDFPTVRAAIADNLTINNGNVTHPAWVTARTECPHLDEVAVRSIYELVYAWDHLLCAARSYTNSAGAKAQLQYAAAGLSRRVNELAATIKE